MARINRSDVIQKAVNDLALSTSDEIIPTQTLDKVQLVYSLNKQFSNFTIQNSQSTTGTMTLTMPNVSSAGGEIYLTAVCYSLAKDATCDVATGRLAVTITNDVGITREIVGIACLTLTADSQTVTLSLPYPVKIKTGTNITVAGAFTTGAMSRFCSVSGFITTSN